MSVRRNIGEILRRAAGGALEILEDSIRTALFRSRGLPTFVYCAVLAAMLYTMLRPS
ncbi:MAG: hypothetical protein PCALPYG88_3750 [uncultured Paraburkholderia sp.]|jgi:hypothetical protein|nr:MAG: hypothetical protein PCALPYG08_3725 [uncultured Paraburkholderia sp.]CAH2926423.1 MAG: hypothetical protein PCALPYG88_3750 [uncultured Paraburkholderia sp.]